MGGVSVYCIYYKWVRLVRGGWGFEWDDKKSVNLLNQRGHATSFTFLWGWVGDCVEGCDLIRGPIMRILDLE